MPCFHSQRITDKLKTSYTTNQDFNTSDHFKMLILIAGITGSLGQSLARVALSRGLSVRGLGRSPGNLSPEISKQLESFVKSDTYHDIPALDRAVSGVDAIINAYSPTPVLDLDGHLLLLRAAERANIKVFIASSWSRDWTSKLLPFLTCILTL